MNDQTTPSILAKRIEMIAWNLAAARREDEQRAAALPVTPVAETLGTVTLRRADYDALVRLAETNGDAI